VSAGLRTLRGRALRSIAVIGLGVVVAGVSASAWLPAIGHWLAMPVKKAMRRSDAIIVHGGNPDRTEYGVGLYRRGLAPELWLTGYERTRTHALDVVVKSDGVPDQAFHFLTSTSTWIDGQQIAATIRARKLHSVVIVTDWWHSRRALCATEQQLQGYNVTIAFEPSPAPAGPTDWWQNPEMRGDVVSELVKLAYYGVRYGMTPWGC